MNIFKSILAVLALGLLIFNLTIIDFSNVTGKESIIALIGVVACICALLLLAILFTAKKIDKKMKENN